MRFGLYGCIGLALCGLIGCNVNLKGDASGGGGAPAAPPALSFKDQVTKGQINGHAWSAASGRARYVQFSKNQNTLEVELWSDATSGDPCARMMASTYSVRLYTPPAVKQYPLDIQAGTSMMVMSDMTHPGQPENNIIPSDGAIDITIFDTHHVVGRMMGRFPAGGGIGASEVNGSFDVPFCAAK